jgi:hypothetical protein
MRDVRVSCGGAVCAFLVVAAGLASSAARHGRTASQDAEQSRFVLAALRQDGVALPFAAYDDGDWSTPWPTSVRDVEIPAHIDAIPEKWWDGAAPRSWSLWRAEAAEPAPLVIRRPIVVVVGRARRIGLHTDYAGAVERVPPFELPYPKAGLAVGGAIRVEPVSRVTQQVENWTLLPTLLREDIDETERKMVRALRENVKWRHPLSDDEREKTMATLETWYTTKLEQPGFSLSYIEAVKKYAPEPWEEGCGLETFISGWVHHNVRQPKPRSNLTAHVAYCDREGASYMLPLGIIRVGNRTHWVFQMSSWEREWYAVVQAVPGRVRYVAEYYGGGAAPE